MPTLPPSLVLRESPSVPQPSAYLWKRKHTRSLLLVAPLLALSTCAKIATKAKVPVEDGCCERAQRQSLKALRLVPSFEDQEPDELSDIRSGPGGFDLS